MLAELKRRTPDTLERVNAEFEARVKAIRIDDGSHVGTKLVTVGAVPLRTAVAACRHAGGDSLHTPCDCVCTRTQGDVTYYSCCGVANAARLPCLVTDPVQRTSLLRDTVARVVAEEASTQGIEGGRIGVQWEGFSQSFSTILQPCCPVCEGSGYVG